MGITEPLTITKQPQDVSGTDEILVDFKIAAEGKGVTYQWQISTDEGETWFDVSSTTTEYQAVLKTDRDGRLVRCIVTDQNGQSVISEAAVMTVKE